MKRLLLIAFFPFLVRAGFLTLAQFDGQDASTTTRTDEVAIPLGTNGAETTFLINENRHTIISGSITSSFTSALTVVASASGFRDPGEDLECHFTAASAGVCVGKNGAQTESGPPRVLVVPISESGTAPTGTGSGPAPTGNGSGSGNGATPGKMMCVVFGGLVLGVLVALH